MYIIPTFPTLSVGRVHICTFISIVTISAISYKKLPRHALACSTRHLVKSHTTSTICAFQVMIDIQGA